MAFFLSFFLSKGTQEEKKVVTHGLIWQPGAGDENTEHISKVRRGDHLECGSACHAPWESTLSSSSSDLDIFDGISMGYPAGGDTVHDDIQGFLSEDHWVKRVSTKTRIQLE